MPDGTMADADAELATVYKDGRKLVQLRQTRGNVRVNKIDVVMTELYDGDIIELDGVRLRFGGPERPPDIDENI
jgi:hypothetical protein